MKEPITKFDLEAAFKALDDLDAPRARKGLKANRPALTEIFSRKTGFDALMEEYYDVNDTAELNDAQEAREAEIAKAKLARIEKIVDLDAESPDDLLASYVGKYIMQCPQCMTLFYKNQEDIEKSEEDPNTVNINEVCQHCGNDSGYTLIGKVGEAAADEEDATEDADLEMDSEEAAEEATEEPEDEDGTEEATEAKDEEDFDLSALDDIDLSEPEQTEESHQFKHDGTPLVENLGESLTEDASDMDISASEFKELISTPEFQRPISDSSVRAMLNHMKDDENDKEVKESVTVNNETLLYAVINADSTFAGVPCVSEEEARELASQQEGRVIVKLEAADVDTLNEGGLGLLGKTLKKRVKQTGKNIKATGSALIDKFADKSMTREEKADWVLANALKDYSSINVDEDGRLVPDVQNQRFHSFVVLCFKNKYNNGRIINMVPSYDNNELVLGAKPQERSEYAEADSLAKGWSAKDGNGPAYIYMAKDLNDSKAAFLCQYFRGELKKDFLEGSFATVQKQLMSSKLVQDGGLSELDIYDDDDESTTESLATTVAGIDDLHEAAVEQSITSSLTEAYANVKNFKLTACTYFNEKLTIDGIISFKSGNTRKTSYVFTEAVSKDNSTKFIGFNEKLGLDKRFIMTGHTEAKAKRFIAESFTCVK